MTRLFHRKQQLLFGGWLLSLPLTLMGAKPTASTSSEVHALASNRDYLDAMAAIQRGFQHHSDALFEIAGVKFERVYSTYAKDLPAADRQKLVEMLCNAWLRSGQAQKVKAFFLQPEDFEDRHYYEAQADLFLRQFEDAEFHIQAYLKAGGKFEHYAQLTLGKALVGQGKLAQAREVFSELVTTPSVQISQEAELYLRETEIAMGRGTEVLSRLGEETLEPNLEFLKAEALLGVGEARKAEKVLLRLRDDKADLSRNLVDAIQLRLVEADAKQDDYKGAGKRLLKFINQEQDTHFYPQAFRLFNDLVVKTEIDPIQSLNEWASMPDSPARQRLALESLAQWHLNLQRPSAAAEVLESLSHLFPHPHVLAEVVPQLIGIYGELGEDRKVLNLADQWRLQPGMGQEMEVDFLTGMVQFKRGDYAAAASLFEKASQLGQNLVHRRVALYNAALAKLLGDDEAGYQKIVATLKAEEQDQAPSDTSSVNLEVEKVLRELRDLNGDADRLALNFIKQTASTPRLVEVYLSLAEYYVQLASPQPTQALQLLSSLPPSLVMNEEQLKKRDFLVLWSNDLAQQPAEVVRVGTAYLERWPEATERELIRLKIGQAYFQLQDYSNAEMAFEQLTEDFPESAHAEAALFFAAKSAMNLQSPAAVERAWALWTEVVAMKGDLAFDARREQVQIRRRQMKFDEAISIIEDLLNSYPQITAEERWSLLIEKGENLGLLARETPAKFPEAVRVFEDLVRDEDLPHAWRSRAGVLLSQLYLQGGKKPEALEACYDVVNRYLREDLKAEALSAMDYLWLYRAGFSALDMLEERQQWGAAAELGDRLAAFGGERASAAKQRAERIRLEHFLWKKD